MNTWTRTQRVWLVAVMCWFVAGVSAAPVNQEPDDLVQAVWAKLKGANLEDEITDVSIRDGAVVLTGEPGTAWAKMQVIDAVLEVEGVERVESDLQVPGPESAEALAQAVVERVLTYHNYTVFDDISFSIVDDGVVRLAGAVTIPRKKDEIEARIAQTKGVRELRSELHVLPVSASDGRLRNRLYRDIYGNPMFEAFAERVNPPIHIIVEASRVTLTGAVRSNVERVMAATIANATTGVMQVENRLQVSP